jgi:hypothetical protein
MTAQIFSPRHMYRTSVTLTASVQQEANAVSGSSGSQTTVGRAEAQLRSARAFALDVAEEMTRSTAAEG